ncbi:MAG: Rad52/Rad22 family DNA repair protein, partial [bacterium]
RHQPTTQRKMKKMTISSDLQKEFPPEALRELNKGGATLTYVPVSEVISRLNKVLGTEGWNITESEAWRDSIDTDWVIAKVTLVALVDGVETTRIGWGGQKIKGRNGPVDLGDEFKGATSDALKKAAQALGVALDLARDEDMLAIEREEMAEKINYDQKRFIKNHIAELPDDEREEYKNWWKTALPGKVLDRGNVTLEDFDLILEDNGLRDAWKDFTDDGS